MTEYPHVLVNDGRGGQMIFPPFIPQANLDTLATQFETLPRDTFVVTFPKCGTTWMEQVIHLLLNDGEQGEKLITDQNPWVEAIPSRPQGFHQFLAQMMQPRVFTSHLPLQLMPGLGDPMARFVYVARNPKDTAVSYYYHDRSKIGYDGSWADHLQLFMAGKLMFGNFFSHVLDWWQASQTAENIFFTTYEAMKADLGQVVTQLADFLDVAAAPALVKTVVEKSRFKAMVTNPQTNFSWVPSKEGEASHFRKGVVGDWRNHFSPEQNEAFDTLFTERMVGSNLRLDFGDGLILP
ncbi:sulfotransferase domain-containing protein [Candidatus Leptofilum sp.]|uniref:sulfotransferase domain-containing protein n=1 Tax=Candidatus Leptofilum sp. TaxID=3241576 RepID=UPI003B5C4127